MAQLICDYNMLREPNLRVPGLAPTGLVIVNRSHSLAPDAFVLKTRRIDAYHKDKLLQGSSSAIWVESDGVLSGTYNGVSTTEFITSGFSVPTPSTDNTVEARGFPYDQGFSSGLCITFSLKITSPGTGPYILYKEGGETNGFAVIYRTTPNKFSIIAAVSDTHTETQLNYDMGSYENTNKWVFVALDFDGTNWRLYVNGVLSATQAAAHGTLVNGTSGVALFGQNTTYGTAAWSGESYLDVFPWNGSLECHGRYARSMKNIIGSLYPDIYQFLEAS